MDIRDFDEIRPYEPEEMKQAFEELINDRQLSLMLRGYAPWLPVWLRNGLLRLAFKGVNTPLDFQKRFMKPIVQYIIRKHTNGCTFDGSSLKTDDATDSPASARYTFLSNHRDIVLDSAFLDVMLIKHRHPTTVEIGIGDNLLIYPWIKRLVRMNKAFTVKRGLTAHEMMRSSQLMSRYIHYAVTHKHENIWIAQREGRAKDSSDHTQDSVLKMLAMGGEGSPAESLREINIVPLTISYEFDPCDFLKAKEFQQKRDNPNYKKRDKDDLENMRTGIFGFKGRVHYHCGTPVNQWIDELAHLPRTEFFTALSQRIDREIYAGYCIYPCNYIALDELEGNTTYADRYTDRDKALFDDYVKGQIAKIDLPDKDEAFLRERILTMYANPLRNHLIVHSS